MNSTSETAAPDFSSKSARKIDRIFQAQQAHKNRMALTGASQRIARLREMKAWIFDHRRDIRDALYADFRKPAPEADMHEIFLAVIELRHAIRHLRRWMKPVKVRRSKQLLTASARIRYQPKGTVLIIAPWNYPFLLTIGPLVSAVAAGNCVVLKPSELAPHTAGIVERMVTDVFPPEECAVIQGEKEIAGYLLQKPFNHIFFTGSSAVGKIVMKAAAENLASVTLELGGKSPAVVDSSADIEDAARKIAWGKFLNAGQTCVAPDYVLVSRRNYEAFSEHLKTALRRLYGDTAGQRRENPDFARIINQAHFERLKNLLDASVKAGAEIITGGETDASQNYFPPTVLGEISPAAPIMQEEIFGPVLPLIPFENPEDAIEIINSRGKALAVYIFSSDRQIREKILAETRSGGSCINDVVVQFFHLNLPFGGVNGSGFGSSHGFYGFKAFSHERAVLKHHRFSPLKLFYPPFTGRTKKLIDLALRYF